MSWYTGDPEIPQRRPSQRVRVPGRNGAEPDLGLLPRPAAALRPAGAVVGAALTADMWRRDVRLGPVATREKRMRDSRNAGVVTGETGIGRLSAPVGFGSKRPQASSGEMHE
jgi:hypothetical protein